MLGCFLRSSANSGPKSVAKSHWVFVIDEGGISEEEKPIAGYPPDIDDVAVDPRFTRP